MKKLILISLLTVVSGYLTAQKQECFKIERVEMKTWNPSYKKFLVTEYIEGRGTGLFCTEDNIVSFTIEGKTSTFLTKVKTQDYIEKKVHHTVWSLYGGGTLTMSFKTTEPHSLIVNFMLDNSAITYYIPEE